MINNKWIIKRHHPSVTTVLVSAGCCVEGREANTKVHQVGCRTKPVRGLAQGAQSCVWRHAWCKQHGKLHKKWSKKWSVSNRKSWIVRTDCYSWFAVWQAPPQVWRRQALSVANYPCRSGRRWQEIPWAEVTAGISPDRVAGRDGWDQRLAHEVMGTGMTM